MRHAFTLLTAPLLARTAVLDVDNSDGQPCAEVVTEQSGDGGKMWESFHVIMEHLQLS